MKVEFKTILTFSLAIMLISTCLGVNAALNSFVKQAIELEEDGESLHETKSEVVVFALGSNGDSDDNNAVLVDRQNSLFDIFQYSSLNIYIKNVSQAFQFIPLYIINCSLKICL